MPHRATPGGYVYHALNRAIVGTQLFRYPEDYFAFEHLLAEACLRLPMRILAYCLMRNHWHLLLFPFGDGELAKYLHWLTLTHARRWRNFRQSAGRGHLYQGPYKSYPIEHDEHLLTVGRYIERNPRSANLVARAEDWRWCSLWRRLHPEIVDNVPPLCDWPVDVPQDWVDIVNEPQTEKELAAMRHSRVNGRPLGSVEWQRRVARELGIETTMRRPGRPRKE